MSAEEEDDLDLDRADFDATDEKATPGSQEETPAPVKAADDAKDSGAGPTQCAICRAGIVDRYFEINAQTACPRCAALLEQQHQAGASQTFQRALLFGIGGGVLGAALYYGVAAIMDAEFGIIAIVVGILVGKGVRRGAGLHRHWVYPALGLGLTYLAIVSTYVPSVLDAIVHQGEPGVVTREATPGHLVAAFLFSLVQPVVMLFRLEIWGPIILAIGLFEGWRYAKGPNLRFEGPFRRGSERGGSQS